MLRQEEQQESAFELDLAEVELRCMALTLDDKAIPTDYQARLVEAGFLISETQTNEEQ